MLSLELNHVSKGGPEVKRVIFHLMESYPPIICLFAQALNSHHDDWYHNSIAWTIARDTDITP